MRYFYPAEQQALFTDRERELAELEYRRDQLHQGRQEHTSLFGLRRIGKTLLLKELVRRTLTQSQSEESDETEEGEVDTPASEIVPVYMDFSHICTSPETFATGYVGWVCYWYLTRGQASPVSYLDIASLTGEVMLAGNREVAGTVRRLAEALRTARPDRPGILRLAFEFPEELAQLAGCKFMLIFDEFQEIDADPEPSAVHPGRFGHHRHDQTHRRSPQPAVRPFLADAYHALCPPGYGSAGR